jgi:DNA-directed RNA polymerase I subunit RPA43
LDGILLAHWEHTYLDETASLINECPFGVVDVQFETLVWAPKLGQKLCKLSPLHSPDSLLGHEAYVSDGTHSLSSPSHLSLLFSNTFNVSIPLQHIPQDLYEFHPTDPDEDDEESDSDSEDELTGLNGLNGHGQVEEVGRWKLRSTGGLVGQGGKGIKFTVIG